MQYYLFNFRYCALIAIACIAIPRHAAWAQRIVVNPHYTTSSESVRSIPPPAPVLPKATSRPERQTVGGIQVLYGNSPWVPARLIGDDGTLADLAIPGVEPPTDTADAQLTELPAPPRPTLPTPPRPAPQDPSTGADDLLEFEDFALPKVDGASPFESSPLDSPGEQPDDEALISSDALLPAPQASVPAESVSPKPIGPALEVFDPLDALPPSMFDDVPLLDRKRIEETPPALVSPPSASDATRPGATNSSLLEPSSNASDFSGNFQPYTAGGIFSSGAETRPADYSSADFLPTPDSGIPANPEEEVAIYRDRFAVPVQRPLIELWRPLYTGGTYKPGKDWFGKYNLVMPHFMVYGDYRTGVGVNRNVNGDFNNWASRLNLDMDLEITATERIHAFMGPLDRTGDFTRLDFTNQAEFVDRTDIRLDNLFFEGDVGAMWGGATGQDAPFDLPVSFGFLPMFYQNGIWANDAVIGAATAIPARHNSWLKWSNFDATFFMATDQINSDAFQGDNNAAEFLGTAWFIEAYDGYIEADYAFVHDDVGLHRSYHNFSVAYTRRYLNRISNSVRFVTNFNQSLPSEQRTADGHLLLIENSLITSAPNTLVPYCNFFYGQGRTQSLARAGGAGGILNNTGINFETDGLTGYPTLDPTAVNTVGGALGVNMLGANFSHQLILELAALSANGSQQFRNADGDQYAVGMRYQKPLTNAWIFRTDHMYGWLRNHEDIRGSRIELRFKF
ncbi:hypothetical protein [Aureliella helgolandensis]|uniref:Uncharacterized protein n=1 Tax=Aureliella helgolandensis TaxID=2527968 RepID=A0A518G3X1_9BACT|nr:hypothetical protein [Aureliella helgolandensis]QDV23293.1 hypothetical protein Q31a_15910 [Aureliella helgolandensis]